jgi:hypothetical protein
MQLLENNRFQVLSQVNSVFPFANIVLLTTEKFIYWLSPVLFQNIWGGNLDVLAKCSDAKIRAKRE